MRQSQHAEAEKFFAQALAAEPIAKWRQLRDTAQLWALLRKGNDALDAGDSTTATQMAAQALALKLCLCIVQGNVQTSWPFGTNNNVTS